MRVSDGGSLPTMGGVPVPERFMPQLRVLLRRGVAIMGEPRLYLEFNEDVEMMLAMLPDQRAEFMAFIVELEDIIDQWATRTGIRPYGKPLAECTGLFCWKQSFDDGMSAREAFDEDRDNWD